MRLLSRLALLIAVLAPLCAEAQILPLRAGGGVRITPQASSTIPAGKNGIWVDSGTPNVLKFRLTGGSDTSLGAGGGAGTLPALYGLGASQTDSTFLLDATRLGLRIRDNASPIGPALFAVQNSGGTKTFFDVTTVGVDISQTAATSGAAPVAVNVVPAAHTGLTAASELNDLYVQGRTVQWATGAFALQRFNRFAQNTLSFVAATTVTVAATVATEGPPLAGTNATCTDCYDYLVGGGKIGSTVALVSKTTLATNGARAAHIWNDQNGATTDHSFSWQIAGTERLTYRADRLFYNPTGTNGIFFDDAGTLRLLAGGITVLTLGTATLLSTTDLQTALGDSTHRYSNVWVRQHNGVEQTVAAAATFTLDPAAGESIRVTLNATAISAAGIAAGTGNPGEVIRTEFIQDVTGSRVLTQANFSTSWVFAGGAYTVTATASRRDIITWMWDATGSKLYEISRAVNLN